MTKNLSDLTEALLSAAKRHGADAADAIAITNDSMSVDVLKGALEQAGRSEATEIGLRVLIGQRSASVSGSDLRSETIDTMAERAVQMARLAPEDPYIGLADPSALTDRRDAEGLDLVDDHAPAPTDLEHAAAAAEAAALEIAGVAQVSSASAAFGRTDIHLAMTNGFSGGYARTGHSLSCVAISGEGAGMERDYHFDSRIHHADLITAEEIGRMAGERAVARANPRKPATGTYPVIYDERIASGLIGHLVSAINGAAIARGASWLKDALGEAVLPDSLTLTENPLRPRVGGSKPFDAEGLPVAARDLVKDGVLQGWTLDLATARKLGLNSTGNASRGVAGSPSPNVSNLSLTQGDKSREDLMRDMGTGFLITSLIGSTINPNTGDYSRGASGFWIENGEIAYPVNECTIAGNLRDMLRRIVPANDGRAHVGRVVPSLLVDGMILAGG